MSYADDIMSLEDAKDVEERKRRLQNLLVANPTSSSQSTAATIETTTMRERNHLSLDSPLVGALEKVSEEKISPSDPVKHLLSSQTIRTPTTSGVPSSRESELRSSSGVSDTIHVAKHLLSPQTTPTPTTLAVPSRESELPSSSGVSDAIPEIRVQLQSPHQVMQSPPHPQVQPRVQSPRTTTMGAGDEKTPDDEDDENNHSHNNNEAYLARRNRRLQALRAGRLERKKQMDQNGLLLSSNHKKLLGSSSSSSLYLDDHPYHVVQHEKKLQNLEERKKELWRSSETFLNHDNSGITASTTTVTTSTTTACTSGIATEERLLEELMAAHKVIRHQDLYTQHLEQQLRLQQHHQQHQGHRKKRRN